MYQMRFWASVHSNGSAHSEHDHADATVSSMGTCSLRSTSVLLILRHLNMQTLLHLLLTR